jgi:hypothetical protein
MNEENERELEAILETYDQKLAEGKKSGRKPQVGDSASISEFKRLQEDVFLPNMEKAGSQLRQHGHDFALRNFGGTYDSEGTIQKIGIEMWIYPAGYDKSTLPLDRTPFIGFFASDTYPGKIRVRGNNYLPGRDGESSSGQRAEFDIGNVSAYVVLREILKLLREVFNS